MGFSPSKAMKKGMTQPVGLTIDEDQSAIDNRQ